MKFLYFLNGYVCYSNQYSSWYYTSIYNIISLVKKKLTLFLLSLGHLRRIMVSPHAPQRLPFKRVVDPVQWRHRGLARGRLPVLGLRAARQRGPQATRGTRGYQGAGEWAEGWGEGINLSYYVTFFPSRLIIFLHVSKSWIIHIIEFIPTSVIACCSLAFPQKTKITYCIKVERK